MFTQTSRSFTFLLPQTTCKHSRDQSTHTFSPAAAAKLDTKRKHEKECLTPLSAWPNSQNEKTVSLFQLLDSLLFTIPPCIPHTCTYARAKAASTTTKASPNLRILLQFLFLSRSSFLLLIKILWRKPIQRHYSRSYRHSFFLLIFSCFFL